jgi:hypothetical protein
MSDDADRSWRWFTKRLNEGGTRVFRLALDDGTTQRAKDGGWVDVDRMEALITDPAYVEVDESEAMALISLRPPPPPVPAPALSGRPREQRSTMSETANLIIAESGWHLRADGRSVDGCIVPFNQPAMVFEDGEIFPEQFLSGCLERMCQIAAKRGNAGWIGLNLDHEESFDKLIGYATKIEQREDGGYASFRLYAGDQLEKVRSMLLESHTGLSVMFGDITAPREIDGIRSRVQIHVSHVAATPAPVYSGASVLALRSGAPEVDRPALREWEQWLADNAKPPGAET